VHSRLGYLQRGFNKCTVILAKANGVLARLSFPLHLSMAQDSASLSARQPRLGVPEIRTISAQLSSPQATHTLHLRYTGQVRRRGTDMSASRSRWQRRITRAGGFKHMEDTAYHHETGSPFEHQIALSLVGSFYAFQEAHACARSVMQ
jgi:hypothetical protein